MPYIKAEDRYRFDDLLKTLDWNLTVGELNYFISSICHNWLRSKGVKYSNLNAVHGVLGCVDKELYRKVTGPYENEKIYENGPVSELDSNP